MASFKSFFPGGVTPDHYTPPISGFDYLPFFEEIVDLSKATQVSATSKTIWFDLDNGLKLKISGTDFKFSSGDPTDGDITKIELYLNDGTSKMQALTGLDISLETFFNAADAYNQYGMAQFLMRGNDTLEGNAGDQDLNGYAGNDKFIGGSGNEYVHGGEGKDTYDGNGGDYDTLAFDDAYYTASAFRGIDLNAATGEVTDPWGNDETFTQFEQFRGTQFADRFVGSGKDEAFMGLGGRDKIDGGGGFDTVLYHRDERRGGTGDVTVNLETGKATDGFGKTDTLTNIEGIRTGDAKDKLTGDAEDNYLRAGGGSDVLAGGLGDDTLRGDGGKDAFVFNTKLDASTNVDFIEDFKVDYDTIRLDNAIFTKLSGTGELTASQFKANSSGNASDTSDRIIYEKDTGELYYDSDGSNTGKSAVHFATLEKDLALTAADFFIV